MIMSRETIEFFLTCILNNDMIINQIGVNMAPEEIYRSAKALPVNLEVAKLMPNKTQTRRLISSFFDNDKNKCSAPDKNYKLEGIRGFSVLCGLWYSEKKQHSIWAKSKYKVGDVLWIREPAQVLNYSALQASMQCKYLADGAIKSFMIPPRLRQKTGGNFPSWILKTNNSLNPSGIPNGCIKEMARTFVKIVSVKAEYLQDITYADILKEGCPYVSIEDALEVKAVGVKSRVFQWWINLWNSTTNDGEKWENNPPVFKYEFVRVF